jgi:hypothetical protein
MTLVCDASALIELAHRSLLKPLLALPFLVAVSDVLHADVRLGLNGLSWPELRRAGLRVETVDARGVAAAAACQIDWPMLSSHECFSVALAGQRRWPLLTLNGCVASAALESGIEVRDLHWLGRLMTDRAPEGRGDAFPTVRCHWRRDSEADCQYRRDSCPAAG